MAIHGETLKKKAEMQRKLCYNLVIENKVPFLYFICCKLHKLSLCLYKYHSSKGVDYYENYVQQNMEGNHIVALRQHWRKLWLITI